MNGEIDLESYTISLIRINTALQKLEDNQEISEIKTLFEESFDDLEKIYQDTVNDLNQEEVNLNEYYLFFQNGKQMFPQYIEVLDSIENNALEDVLGKLTNVFRNLDKIADAFNQEKENEIRSE
ncbi:MAG: hypothetical protein ILA26_05690 [Methanobrevibacter sp.]|uniref:hypothetical protein n=1 Tax=Methanobrevibacter sp. TaxID=66852 RepID=UPI001B7BBCA1|nr:hypothetical protein [Methanobrevibacter sp.]MBP3791501.1 hypothetical protein [Methanobrevibacter sp.]